MLKMNEKVSKNPLKINEDDSLGVIVLKTVAYGAVSTVATYGGIFGAFAVVGYVAKKFESKKGTKKEPIGALYKINALTEDGTKFSVTMRALSEEDARKRNNIHESCTIEDVEKVDSY